MLRHCKRRSSSFKRAGCVFLLFALPSFSAIAESDWNAGLLYDEFPLTLTEGNRQEAVGPLFYNETRESEHTFAVPPLFSQEGLPSISHCLAFLVW